MNRARHVPSPCGGGQTLDAASGGVRGRPAGDGAPRISPMRNLAVYDDKISTRRRGDRSREPDQKFAARDLTVPHKRVV